MQQTFFQCVSCFFLTHISFLGVHARCRKLYCGCTQDAHPMHACERNRATRGCILFWSGGLDAESTFNCVCFMLPMDRWASIGVGITPKDRWADIGQACECTRIHVWYTKVSGTNTWYANKEIGIRWILGYALEERLPCGPPGRRGDAHVVSCRCQRGVAGVRAWGGGGGGRPPRSRARGAGSWWQSSVNEQKGGHERQTGTGHTGGHTGTGTLSCQREGGAMGGESGRRGVFNGGTPWVSAVSTWSKRTLHAWSAAKPKSRAAVCGAHGVVPWDTRRKKRDTRGAKAIKRGGSMGKPFWDTGVHTN